MKPTNTEQSTPLQSNAVVERGGTMYNITPKGQFMRLTPKRPNKKERKKLNKMFGQLG